MLPQLLPSIHLEQIQTEKSKRPVSILKYVSTMLVSCLKYFNVVFMIKFTKMLTIYYENINVKCSCLLYYSTR